MVKTENKKKEYKKNVSEISLLIKDMSAFFFYFSPDPDAVGASIAFSLYLRHFNKECCIFMPEGFDENLQFLLDIAVYNNIVILQDIDSVLKFLKEKSPLFVIIDTATRFLLSNFNEIENFKKKYCPEQSIEIDHHFGGDSEMIYEKSVSLFSRTNSSCEIVADFLDLSEKELDIKFPRNIVLSLLAGMCFDTQFGKFITNENNYIKWFDLLSERLIHLTWKNTKHLRTSKQVFAAITKMNDNKIKVLNSLMKSSKIINGIGLLVLPDKKMNESLTNTGDSSCIFGKILTDLSNKITEKSGKLGIVAFYDDIQNLFYIKARRAYNFNGYDLRNIEGILNKKFGKYMHGGGGHPGAVSYRFKEITRELFIDKVKEVHKHLSEIIE